MLRWTGGNRARAEFEMQQIRSRKSNGHNNIDTTAPLNVNVTEAPGSASSFGGSRPPRYDPEFHNNINTTARTSSSTDVRSLRRIGRQQRTHTTATPPTSVNEAEFVAHESSAGVPIVMLQNRDPNVVYDDQPPGSWPQGGCNYNSAQVDDGSFAPSQDQPKQFEQQNGEFFFSNHSVEGFFPQPPAPLDDSHFDLNAARVIDVGNGGWDGGPDDDDDVQQHDPYAHPTDFSGLLMPPNPETFQHQQFHHQQQQWSATPPSWGDRHPAMMAGADEGGDFSGNQTPNAWHGGFGDLSAPLMPQPCQWPGGAVRNVGGGEFAFPDPIPTRRTDRRPNGINSSDLELAPQLSPVLPVPEDHNDDPPWGWNELQQHQPPPNGNRQGRKWSFSSAPFPQHLLPPPREDEPVIGQRNGAADMFPAGALRRNTKIGRGAPATRNPHRRDGHVRPQPAHRLPLRRFGGGKNASSGVASSAQRGADTKRSRPTTRVKPLKQKRREGAGLDSGRPSDDDGDDSFQQPEDHVMFTPGLLFRTPRTP